MSAPNISYHQFWNGLVEEAKHLVIKELQTYRLSQTAVVEDVQLWVRRATEELKVWNELHNYSKEIEITESIKQLRELPRAIKMAKKPDDVLWKMTSVSLFRLRPFRRTMLWDLFSNLLLPREYIEERIEKTEASLTSGETAFAAFAASFSSGNENGMVVGDCRDNLRGTYFLIDRAIGLRSNVVFPMRRFGNEDDARRPILAMVVVSLPFANAFSQDFTRRLVQALRNYEVYVELMWGYDQLAEQAEFEEKPYARDDIPSIIDDLTPDAASAENQAVLPGCAVFVGEATGGGEMGAAVELNSLHLRTSPRHQSLFAQSELELEAYGVHDRSVSLKNFIDLGGSHEFRLMASMVQGQSDFKKLPPEATWVFEKVGATISKSFVRGGKACRTHRQQETQRALFNYLLDYLATGVKQYREKFERDLHYSRSLMKGRFDFAELSAALDLLNDWALEERFNWKYLTLCKKKRLFSLVYRPDSLTYLSGFEIDLPSQDASFLLSDQSPDAIHNQTRNVALELGGPRRFIAWSRALNALLQAIPDSEQVQNFRVKEFAILDESKHSEFICYLPSMMLPEGASMQITKAAESTSVLIRSSANDWTIKSEWQSKPTLLPLCTACDSSKRRVQVSEPGDVSKLEPIRLAGLRSDKLIFFDLRRRHGATQNRNWRFDPGIKSSLRPLARMIVDLASGFPTWFASMDCLAIVPMPFDDSLQTPTFSQWSQGNGRRHLLVAGILRQSTEQDVDAEWDIEVIDHTSHDPFIERFKALLGTLQRRQSGKRRIEALMQSQFILTHLLHDVCSNNNIQTLRKVLTAQEKLLRPKAVSASIQLRDAELFVDDLEQLQGLARGIKSSTQQRRLNLAEIVRYVEPAKSHAIFHVARKLSRGSHSPVSNDDLSRIVNLKSMCTSVVKDAETHLVFVLLDNLIRNALEGAWEYNRQSMKNRGRVCIVQRPLENTLVIANEAEPGRWKRTQRLYAEAGTTTKGITIIQLITDFLKLTCSVKLVSDTRGEIHLIA